MASDAAAVGQRLAAPLSPSRLGLVGQVATSWGVAGGLIAAVVVTAHVLAGQLSSSLGFLTTTLFFLVGSLAGYLHGAILAYLGRPAEVDRRLALHRLALAALYAVPIMVGGWMVSMVLAMSAASMLAGRTIALLTSLVGWAAALVLVAWAVLETWGAVRNLCARWPGAGSLMVMLALAFLAMLPIFMVTRPRIWVVGVKPTATAAGIMALAATLWILAPLATLGLLAARAWAGHQRSSPGVEAQDGGD